MVETIAPVVYGSRSRYLRAVVLHAVAASASAGLVGAAAGLLGMAFGAPWGRVGAAALVAVAALYVAREVVGLPVPTFDRKRQVPDWWRTFYAPELAAVMYGAGLGIGFLTFLGHGTFVVVTALAAASGDPLIGALLVAPFGVARGLSVLIVVRTRDEEGPADLVARLSSIGTRWWRRGANATACALVAALALTSCSNPESPASTSPNPSLEPFGVALEERAHLLGKVESDALTEVSGLAASRVYEDMLWVHNDSGDGPFLYCVRTTGASCGVFEVSGADATDWEDIAIGPHPGSGRDHIYIGDIGDNRQERGSVTVYVIAEPDPGKSPPRATAIVHDLTYPGGPRDAEALMVDPNGDIFIVTKTPGRATLYVAHAPLARRERLERVGQIDLGSSLSGVTGGDISSDGRSAVLATYSGVYELVAPDGSFRWWAGTIRRLRMGRFRQLEAVAYGDDGTTVYATSEGRHPPIRALRVKD